MSRGAALTILLGVLVVTVAAMLWWIISDRYHEGPSYYTLGTPRPHAPAIYVADAAHAKTASEALGQIAETMGPQWTLAIHDSPPDAFHITIRPVSGLAHTASGWKNCLNPEWRGSADYADHTIHVCTDWWRDPADVRHAILHETIHMMGVGHHFGQGPNIMCSGEDGRTTCAHMGRTSLAEDAHTRTVLLYLYGEDGWAPPNRAHPCQKFYAETSSCAAP